MSQVGTPLETMHGYSTPCVRQFSVFLENKVGKLHELVRAFDTEPDCTLCAINVHEASDHAVVRLVPNNSDAARAVLKRLGYFFAERDIIVVELRGDHTLSSLCLSLLSAELNIFFAYPVMLRPNGAPTIALSVDDLFLAGQVLRKKGFRLLGEADLPRRGCEGS